ncbi:MAG: hypothetical protein GWP09_02190 [Nitrospiraceae bacterium]|nr:hypothetical protein [Nitrospiraceae bacterium]
MQIDVIKDTKETLIFEVKDEDTTFFDVLKNELYKVKGVKAASYARKHPLVNKLTFVVETDGKISPRDALKKGSESVKKDFNQFLSKFNSLK